MLGNTEKTVWMTTNNYKNRGTGSASAGYIYFKITNDTITKSDKKLYVVIEYLESGTGNLSMSYITNTGKSADGGTSGITPAFKRRFAVKKSFGLGLIEPVRIASVP